MRDEKLLKEIRSGECVSSTGFLFVIYRGMPEHLEKLSWQAGNNFFAKSRDKNIGMPVIVVGWQGSGYKPAHQSLN